MVFVIKVVSFWIFNSIVKHQLSCLGYLFCSLGNLIVKSIRDRYFANLRYCVSRNTPTLYSSNPLINSELSFAFVHKLLQFLLLTSFSVGPPVILNCYDIFEALVFSEFAIDPG